MKKITTEELQNAYQVLNYVQSKMYDELKKEGRKFSSGRSQTNIKRMPLGNSKLHSMLVFDLLAGKKGACKFDCAGCYAKKAYRYDNPLLYQTVNYFMALFYTDKLEILLRKQLENTRLKTVRIHSSGDFFSDKYIKMWESIMKNYPQIKFYAYTKMKDTFDFTNIQKLDNFNLIDSFATIEEKKVFNFGDTKHIETLVNNGYFLCPATKTDWKGKCNKECFYCITNEKVCFNQH